MTLSFTDHVAALEYMWEENPKMKAWMEGPLTGAYRLAYVEAHKAHAQAIESGDTDAIDSAWTAFCTAQNAWVEHYHTGSNPLAITIG